MENILSPSVIEGLFARLYPRGGKVLSARLNPRSYNFEVWHLTTCDGHYALKVAQTEMAASRLANMLAAQQIATDAGVPGPRILCYDEGAFIGRPFLVQEWIDGQDAETAWPAMTLQERESFSRQFGRSVAQMHAIPGPCFSEDVLLTHAITSWAQSLHQYLKATVAGLSQANLLSPTTRAHVVSSLEKGIMALPPTIAPALTHWDLWLANTLVNAGACVGIIDWESAAFSDPLVDFVRLEVWVSDRYLESRTPFLVGYTEQTPIPEDMVTRLWLYRGIEYLAEIYRTNLRGERESTALFQDYLTRWIDTYPSL